MNVMKRAWEIAREGQSKFGGKVSEYFTVALKMAWAEAKAPKTVKLTISAGSRKHKSWVAKINGTHPKWKLNREFVESVDHNMMERYFDLVDGVYEVCDGGEREFIQIVNGNVEVVGYNVVVELVA